MKPPLIIGFAANKAQSEALSGAGVPIRRIYQDGRGAETIHTCLDAFRGRPGTLLVAHDLRVLGPSKREVAAIVATMEKSGISVRDISHPEDMAVAEMLQRAFVAISGSRFGDRRKARSQGRKGGKQRGVSAQSIRDGNIPRDVVYRIVKHPALSWQDRLDILGTGFSESTLRRRYLNQ